MTDREFLQQMYTLEIRQQLAKRKLANDDDDTQVYRSELEAAVKAEREACAKVCEEYETANDITATWLNIVANAIRARGDKV